MKTVSTKFDQQIELTKEIQSNGLNLVQCGNCSGVFIHKMDDEILTCPHCEIDIEPCNCEDIFYEGMYIPE